MGTWISEQSDHMNGATIGHRRISNETSICIVRKLSEFRTQQRRRGPTANRLQNTWRFNRWGTQFTSKLIPQANHKMFNATTTTTQPSPRPKNRAAAQAKTTSTMCLMNDVMWERRVRGAKATTNELWHVQINFVLVPTRVRRTFRKRIETVELAAELFNATASVNRDFHMRSPISTLTNATHNNHNKRYFVTQSIHPWRHNTSSMSTA